MDDKQAFIELSSLLTGLYDQLSDGAEEYARLLHGGYPEKFPALLGAYRVLAEANPKPRINDALLARLGSTQVFKDNELVAKQIVNLWYLSQFNDESGELIDGGFYERGAVWTRIKAHPIGFSTQLHGYWTRDPSKEAS